MNDFNSSRGLKAGSDHKAERSLYLYMDGNFKVRIGTNKKTPRS